jgi:hypothetical protein
MQELTGTPDTTLCEFLLTVESNSELAEYCTLYLGNAPAVSHPAARLGSPLGISCNQELPQHGPADVAIPGTQLALERQRRMLF